MVEKDRIITLINRDTGSVGYTIPDTNTHRRFIAGEAKNVTFDEVEKLSWAQGGLELLRDYLIINDQEAAKEILGTVEPEYFYTKTEVKKLLTEGTLEQLQDTLEFGPKGVVDLVKQEAVELQVNNVAMRDEIQKHTNFNVNRAIEIEKASKEEDEENKKEEKNATRRANPVAASRQDPTGRRAEAIASESKYKVID